MSIPGQVIPTTIPSSLDAGLANSVAAPIFCVIVTSGRFEPVWQLHSAPAYKISQVDETFAVKVAGVDLTLAASIAAVISTPGTFYWDGAYTYIHLLADANPNTRDTVVETFLRYRFTDGPNDSGGYAWKTKLVDLPTLSVKIPDDFKNLVQIGGGTLTLENEDRFFTSRLKQNWDAGETQIIMGVAGLPWAQFRTLATFSNFQSPVLTDQNFMLQVKESKIRIDRPFPLTLYMLADFPSIFVNDVSRAIQYAYGVLRSVNPVCIDTSTQTFQVAGHAIRSFEGVRVRQTDGSWLTVNFASTSTALAQFTLSTADWTPGQDVAVDFNGRIRTNGTLMDNPAEVAGDILTALGQTIDAASFEAARLWYDAGFINTDTTDRYSLKCPALYLDTQTSALATLNNLMFNSRAYLKIGATGMYTMQPFRTYQGSTLVQMKDSDMLDAGITQMPFQQSAVANKISKCTVTYGFRPQEGFNESYTYEKPANQYTRNQPSPVIFNFASLFYTTRDAKYLAQALVNEYNVDPMQYSADIKWKAFTWNVAQGIHIVSTLKSLDVLAEVLSINIQLKARRVALTFGNLRGNDESMGFWVLSSNVCPDGSSLAWTNGNATQAQYRRHQAGHWHNSKDQATDTPLSALDWTVSRWF